MSDQTTADIDGIRDFGTKTLAQLKDASDLMTAGLTMAPGQVGTNEARTFADWYQSVVAVTGASFLKDLNVGLQALGNGAIVESANYRSGDHAQAATMDGVLSLFRPSAKEDSVRDDLRRSGQHGSGARLASTHRSPWEAQQDREADRDGAPSPAETARQQYAEHNHRYGRDETWHPPVSHGPRPHPAPGPSLRP